MEGVINVEQYFMYEVVATFNAVVDWIKGENRNINQWNNQINKLKKAFHYFMMESELEEFKDLKLPSEKKRKKKGTTKKENGSKSGVVQRVKTGGKQLRLFFTRNTKKALLGFILYSEIFTEWCVEKLFGKVEDFENRRRDE